MTANGRPSDLPPAEHYAHGTRARYVTGCRCDACRGSNRAYYHERQHRAKAAAALIVAPEVPVEQLWTAPDGTRKARTYKRACPGVNGQPCPIHAHLRKDSKGGVCRKCRWQLSWNGLVDAEPARTHLAMLSKVGVGHRAVEAACGVAHTVLAEVISGKKTRIRVNTSRDILSVDTSAKADGALVPARNTWKRVKEMVKVGYSKAELAKELGHKKPALQMSRRQVTMRTEHEVKKLHEDIMDSLKRPSICTQCGQSHSEMNRRAILSRVLPAKFEDIVEMYPCLYSNDVGNRRLYRDLHKANATSEDAVWSLLGLRKY